MKILKKTSFMTPVWERSRAWMQCSMMTNNEEQAHLQRQGLSFKFLGRGLGLFDCFFFPLNAG